MATFVVALAAFALVGTGIVIEQKGARRAALPALISLLGLAYGIVGLTAT